MIALAFAEGAPWYNYPGLELWKFANLAIFTAIAIYVLRRRIAEALATRRDAIKQELIEAQEQKAQAVAKMSEAEALLSRLHGEVSTIAENARQEADAERQRVAAAASLELDKLKLQAEREMETADKVARKELRQFLAQRSIEVARENVRGRMEPEVDRALIEESIGELRRARV